MPSPNGYMTAFSYAVQDRQSFRVTVNHDVNSPPWNTPVAGSYTFIWETGPTAAGPWTAAPLTDLGVGCTPQPDNITGPGGVTDTIVRIGDPAPGGTTADTDYFVRVTLHDENDVQVDQWVLDEPAHTEAYPEFICLGPDVTQTTADVGLGNTSGRVNLSPPCNRDSIVWELATVSGGPYTAEPSEPVTTLSPDHTFTGLTPDTQYFYRARLSEQAQTGGEYLVTEECTFTTEAAVEPPGPPAFEPQPCAGGGAGESADVEGTLVCDVDATGNVLGVALVEAVYDETGTRTGTRLVDPATGLDYVPQGTIQPCPEGCCPEPVVLCDVQEDGSTVQFIRSYTGQTDGGLTVTDQLLDGSVYVPIGTVGACDPYSTCTPTSDQDLNGQCGPGETADQILVAADAAHPLANSVFVDDTSADALCGGSWDRPASALAAPFPVNESFRNTTFDQPGPVLQGTAPYPDLTADVDGAGAGWLQVSDINSGTNGLWQVPASFPTSQGMNAAITWASHDGTTPGGDGMAFVFTDGSVPPQSIPVGGFGNLGLQNWQGGYVAVVVDEYGQTCTCSHATQGTIDPNAGPCGFCTNTISIQLAGAARETASCACCTIASMPLAPKALNQTTRFSPARILVSIIEEGGQTYVSASIDWNDGNGAVQYFDRVNVTACAGPPPTTLRMASYGGSGGAYRAVKEFRDATARPAGVSNWRSFPITTDAIPACTTLVNVRACVDVTFNNDTQTTGNSDPEAYLLLIDSQTGDLLDRDVQSSIPAQIGNPNQLCVEEAVPPEKVPFLRVYVGAESRDQNGEYDQLWENLEITVTGTGCPAQPRRTMEISARCPIPVTIVGGDADGGGGGTTVVNTPATFEDAPVCMTVGGETIPGFRREVRNPDGNVEVSFLGIDGLPQTPDTWTAGGCSARDTEIVELCDLQPSGVAVPYLRVFTYDENGEVTSTENQDADGNPYTPTGITTICALVTITQEVLCDEGNGGAPFLRSYVRAGGVLASVQDQELDGATPYLVVGPVGNCGAADADRDREVVCWTQTSTGDEIHTGTIRHDDSLPAPGWLLFDQHQTPVSPAEPGLTFVPCTECCPVVLATDLCATGDRSVTSLRMPDGTVLLVDQEDGSTVLPGDIIACPSTCQNATTLLVCDLPTGDPDGTPTVTDSAQQFIADTANADFIQRPGGGGALWTGGVINFGPDASTGPGVTQVHRYVAATLQAVPPSCTDGTVHVSLSVEALNIGPGDGCSGAGRFRLYRVSDGAVLASGSPLVNTPAGTSVTLTIEADIPAAELTAGNVAVWLDVETFQTGTCPPPDDKTWQASNFTASYAYGQEGCATQFFRTVVTSCETGETLATVDTTPDGAPYVVTGEVGDCGTSSSGDSCPCVSAASIGQAVADALVEDPVTLRAQHFDVLPGTPWTPALAAGAVITGITYIVLAGTATVVDALGATSITALPTGLSATWNNDQEGSLTPPSSIAADTASRVYVTWTEQV